jgi:hypothetical protein
MTHTPTTTPPTLVQVLLRPDEHFGGSAPPPSMPGWGALGGFLVLGLQMTLARWALIAAALSGRPGLIGVEIGTLIGSAFFVWFGGRAWFRIRLRLAGARGADRHAAHTIFAWTVLVAWLPIVILGVVHLIGRPAGGVFATAIGMGAHGWSLFVGYRAVTAAFPVSRRGARIWFILVPLLLEAALYALNRFGSLSWATGLR